jgi:hypothetical protein
MSNEKIIPDLLGNPEFSGKKIRFENMFCFWLCYLRRRLHETGTKITKFSMSQFDCVPVSCKSHEMSFRTIAFLVLVSFLLIMSDDSIDLKTMSQMVSLTYKDICLHVFRLLLCS